MDKTVLKVLIVEDNELNQKFALALVHKFGYLSDVAENGLVALDLFKKNTYDLILMDIQMPEMNGIEATKEIRKLEGMNNLVRTPIIAVTAFAMEHDRRNCIDAGMDEFLTKPYKPSDLDMKIKSVMTK
ncbi:MAG: response regulator [Bacteroidales bacterium]